MFGAFWQAKVPKAPASSDQATGPAHDLDATDGDFCFCYLPAQGLHAHFTAAAALPLAQIAVNVVG